MTRRSFLSAFAALAAAALPRLPAKAAQPMGRPVEVFKAHYVWLDGKAYWVTKPAVYGTRRSPIKGRRGSWL